MSVMVNRGACLVDCCCLLLLARGYCALFMMPVQHFATCAFCLRRATGPNVAAVTRAFRPARARLFLLDAAHCGAAAFRLISFRCDRVRWTPFSFWDWF